ncbi:hypothetical protein CCACVL1_12322 [Corchorus capsularis]|uniref:Cyclin C-terminal domain-containing protein n=1 Tax=Corchorus capsularis TaxID=210143 RepID=A0A1R3IGG4_COCAP|nr:hypothetical protein CCACVL1_12322 [Corchorus capsularis]
MCECYPHVASSRKLSHSYTSHRQNFTVHKRTPLSSMNAPAMVEVATAFMKAYSDLGGDVSEIYHLFLETNCCQDIVFWTSMITAFAERDPAEAFFLYRQLLREDLTPDGYTFSIILKACAGFVADLVSISDYAFVEEQILAMEKAILEKLVWYLTVPTPCVPYSIHQGYGFTFIRFGAHYITVVQYSPSLLAAAAVYAARCTLNRTPFWTATLKHHTGYSEEQLMSCAKLLIAFHQNAAKGKLRGIYSKFVSPSRGGVALLTPAKALLASP